MFKLPNLEFRNPIHFLFLIIIGCLFLGFAITSINDGKHLGEVGDFFNGMLSPIISFYSALLLYLAFSEQRKSNELIEKSSQSSKEIEFFRIYNEILKNIGIKMQESKSEISILELIPSIFMYKPFDLTNVLKRYVRGFRYERKIQTDFNRNKTKLNLYINQRQEIIQSKQFKSYYISIVTLSEYCKNIENISIKNEFSPLIISTLKSELINFIIIEFEPYCLEINKKLREIQSADFSLNGHNFEYYDDYIRLIQKITEESNNIQEFVLKHNKV